MQPTMHTMRLSSIQAATIASPSSGMIPAPTATPSDAMIPKPQANRRMARMAPNLTVSGIATAHMIRPHDMETAEAPKSVDTLSA